MAYTNSQINRALGKYQERIDPISTTLAFLPLNEKGVYRIAHSGKNFLIVEEIRQQTKPKDNVCSEAYSHELSICSEMILNENPELEKGADLRHLFAGRPLQSEKPFFMVAYDPQTMEYVLQNSRPVKDL